MSKWITAFKNRLPDAAFLYIAPGGRKDKSGRTTPRSLRHLPVLNLRGEIDLSHVRSVLGSYGQRADIPADAKRKAIARARRLLAAAGGRPHAPEPHVRSARLSSHALHGRTCHHCGRAIEGAAIAVHAAGGVKHYHREHVKHRHAKHAPSVRRTLRRFA